MCIEETNKLLPAERDQVSDRHFPAIYIGALAVSAAEGIVTLLGLPPLICGHNCRS
jgi:hypothetical protein